MSIQIHKLFTTTNNSNNRICTAIQVCRLTSEALDGQLQSCYTTGVCLTEEKCFKTTFE